MLKRLFSILVIIGIYFPSQGQQKTSPSDVLDMAVLLGQAEVFLKKNDKLGYRMYVEKTAIPNSKKHASNSNYFQNSDIEFNKLLVQKPISSEEVVKARQYFTNQIKTDSIAYIYDLGVLLGQIEAFSEIWKQEELLPTEIKYIYDVVIPKVSDDAKRIKSFQKVDGLIKFMKGNRVSKINLHERITAVRLAFSNQLIPKTNSFKAGANKIELKVDIGENVIYTNKIPSTKIRDPLFAKSVVFENNKIKFSITSIDAVLIYNSTNVARIKKQLKEITDIDNILLVATHNHSSVEFSVDSVNIKNNINQQIREEQIVTAILRAENQMVEAEIGFGTNSTLQGFNRLIRNGATSTHLFANCIVDGEKRNEYIKSHPLNPIDSTLSTLVIRNKNKEIITTLVNYAMHGVVLGDHNSEISSDYMGELTRIVEENTNNAPCLFLQGAAGDIDPWCCVLDTDQGSNFIKIIGKEMAEKVLNTIDEISIFDNNPKLVFKTKNLPINDCSDPTLSANHVEGVAELNTISIGKDLALATFSGELFTELGLQLKQKSPFKKTLVIGYTNHAIGYLPPEKDWGSGGYGTMCYLGRNPPEVPNVDPNTRTCFTAKGTGEKLISESLDMLKNMINK